jgi:hypothetical protein
MVSVVAVQLIAELFLSQGLRIVSPQWTQGASHAIGRSTFRHAASG